VKETIEKLINTALKELGMEARKFVVKHPTQIEFGDYSTNVGIITGKSQEILKHLEVGLPSGIERVKEKAGFINFYLSKEFFAKSLEEIIKKGENFGKNDRLKGKKVIIEYTDPNPFKEFHIGHLMSNAIGEAISRVIENEGAEVKRFSYGGDVGLHVAKAIYGVQTQKEKIEEIKKVDEKKQLKFWTDSYVNGSTLYEENPEAKTEIDNLNKVIFDKSDSNVQELYDWGREISIKHFQEFFSLLGTKFDRNFWESEVVEDALKAIELGLQKNILEKSEGAVIFKGENYNLHTRVFMNSKGVPTYEAKDLGLGVKKFKMFQFDRSIVITGNEQNEYFKVMLKVMDLLKPEVANKTTHLGHGMLRLPTGKMGSRTGNVITAEFLIEEVKKVINARGQEATDDIAVGAIKYMILKQGIGNDIIFDFEKSVSTEGDSGPYLQYAYARTNSLLEKANTKSQTLNTDSKSLTLRETHEVERLLYRFPEIVERAGQEYAPQLITTYLIELSSAFNNFYAQEQVISDSPETPYRLAIVKAFNIIIKNGLSILGIPTPERI